LNKHTAVAIRKDFCICIVSIVGANKHSPEKISIHGDTGTGRILIRLRIFQNILNFISPSAAHRADRTERIYRSRCINPHPQLAQESASASALLPDRRSRQGTDGFGGTVL
jgi:hypothetical protein